MGQTLRKYGPTVVCTGILLLLSCFGCMMVIVRREFLQERHCGYLAWNLFLAWIPLVVSLVMAWVNTRSGIKKKLPPLVLLGIVWLLFYPNAPYMITDFIHFQVRGNMLTWYDLVMYSIFTLTSFLIGFLSMYLVGGVVKQRTKPVVGWLFTMLVLLLSSYGVYLGRFIRWNSWDLALNPLALLNSVWENINLRSILFTLLFSMLLMLIYAFLYGLTRLKLEPADWGTEKIETDEVKRC